MLSCNRKWKGLNNCIIGHKNYMDLNMANNYKEQKNQAKIMCILWPHFKWKATTMSGWIMIYPNTWSFMWVYLLCIIIHNYLFSQNRRRGIRFNVACARIHSFIHSFFNYLLRTNWVLGPVLSTTVSQRIENSFSLRTWFQSGKTIITQEIHLIIHLELISTVEWNKAGKGIAGVEVKANI